MAFLFSFHCDAPGTSAAQPECRTEPTHIGTPMRLMPNTEVGEPLITPVLARGPRCWAKMHTQRVRAATVAIRTLSVYQRVAPALPVNDTAPWGAPKAGATGLRHTP